MDLEVLQSRLDYFHSLGYITYHSEEKEFPLLPVSLLLAIKVYSMSHNLHFPRVNAKTIRGAEIPIVYLTELGEGIFIKYLEAMSVELFEMIAPVYKGQINPATFALKDSKLLRNIKGLDGKKKKAKRKVPLSIHLLVDNSAPFEYLKPEYIWDGIYEARLFINKLVRYVPPSRLELWRVRVDGRSGQVRRDPEPVLITKRPYKV
jgi:hypothetical protein